MADDLAFSLKELRRAKSIVSSLLDLSRQSQSYTEEVSLTVVCQDALRILHNRIKLLPIDVVRMLRRKTCPRCAATSPIWGRWP